MNHILIFFKVKEGMKAELKGVYSLKENPCICFFFKFYQNKNFL